jgi:hypothetical protein
MNPKQEVHLRLVSTLPTRTVVARERRVDPDTVYSSRKQGELRGNEERERLIRRVHRLSAAGVERRDIAEALDLSTPTVDRYLALDLSTAPKGAKRR